MKKISFLVIAFCVSAVLAKAQNPYNDVIRLRSMLNEDQQWKESAEDSIIGIFSNYCSKSEVRSLFFNKNVFTKRFSGSLSLSGSSGPQNAASLISSIGGLDVTNFADGMAKFLVERTKQELSIAFFDRFKDEIKESKELRTLFPQTYRTLLAIDKEIYQFNAYLNTLREVFSKDMANLYTNVKALTHLPEYDQWLLKHPEIKMLVTNAFYFTDAFAAGKHPGDIIAGYDVKNITLDSNKHILTTNLRSSVALLKLFSASVKSLSPDHYWVPADSVRSFFADPVKRDLYFGILYQQARNINFQSGNNTHTVSSLLETIKNKTNSYETDITEYINQIQTITEHAETVSAYLKDLKEKKKEVADFTGYYQLYQASFTMVNDAFGITELPGFDRLFTNNTLYDFAAQGKRIDSIIRQTTDLYLDIRTRQYASAIINAVGILDRFSEDPINKNLNNQLLKYGSLMANIASAKNSDEVKSAIEAIAMPVGSSRVKRLSSFNVSLNAYVGLALGHEWIGGAENNDIINTTAVTAPVGIAVSWGNLRAPFTLHSQKSGTKNDPKFRGHSFSLFVSLIDLGAVTAYRFGGDTSVSKLPEIKLKNILAPGVFVSWGIKKTPLSLNAGYQMGPMLREVSATIHTLANNYYQRLILSVTVDIPLLNLHTKSK